MKNRQILLFTMILAIALAGAACDNSTNSEPPQTETITIGSELDREPGGTCSRLEDDPPCTLVAADSRALESPDAFDDPWRSPVDGVITKIRMRAYADGDEPAEVTFRVAEIVLVDPDLHDECSDCIAEAVAVHTGRTVEIPPHPDIEDPDVETPIHEFEVNMPVQEGQNLAIDTTADLWAVYSSSAQVWTWLFAPPLVDGSDEPQWSSGDTQELLIQADIEYEME